MTDRSSMHAYLNWAKQRLDEMDATLASFETQSASVKADSRAKCDQLITDMKKRRDDFQSEAKAQAEAGEVALKAGMAQLQTQWHGFEADVTAYFETLGRRFDQQKATFQNIAAAQMKVWREAAEAFQAEGAKIAAARRADLETAVKEMKADAMGAEARLQKLKEVGSETWAALSVALAESRQAFERANKKAGDALNDALAPDI